MTSRSDIRAAVTTPASPADPVTATAVCLRTGARVQVACVLDDLGGGIVARFDDDIVQWTSGARLTRQARGRGGLDHRLVAAALRRIREVHPTC